MHIDPNWLHHQTERIDTRCDRPDSTRALVVWNTGDASVSGIALFHADYALRVSVALPTIVVRASDGTLAPSSVLNYRESEISGEPDRRRIVFDLAFGVLELPARSWATYFASYSAEAAPASSLCGIDMVPDSVIVLETLCRAGELPIVGSFDNLSPFMLY